MNKYLLGTVAIVVFVVGAAISGFAPSGDSSSASKNEPVVLEGCLEEGDEEEGYYVLVIDEEEEIPVMGTAALSKHVGHRVRLTGTWIEDEEGETSFNVSKIEHISNDCE